MKKQMDNILRSAMISWIIFLVLGIFLVVKAELTLRLISYIIGGILVLAIIPIIKAITNGEKIMSFIFVTEIIMVVAGLVIILNPELIVSVIPLFIGIILLINGINKLQLSNTLKKSKLTIWKSTFGFGIVITLIGLLFIINPFKGAVVITETIGFIMILYSIADMIDFLVIKKTVKQTDDYTNETHIKIIEEE